MITDDDRNIRAGLSFYAGRLLPDHLTGAVASQDLQVGTWVFPKPAAGLPVSGQQALDQLRALGRSLRERAAAHAVALMVADDPGWPGGTGCDDLPCLWVQGHADVAALLDQSVALTGARTASDYGLQVTEEFTARLVEARRAVVTSTAPGIGQRARAAARSRPGSRLVLVSDRGLDQPFDQAQTATVQHAPQRTALISAFPPGGSPTPSRSLFAERLLLRIAAGTVVMETALSSHIVVQARDAARAGYRVYAVPGPVTSPVSAGCHQLISEGAAQMVTDVDDVINTVDVDRPAFLKPFTVTVELHRGGGTLGSRSQGPFMVWAASVAHAANTAFDLVDTAPNIPVDLTVWVHNADGGREAIAINRAS
jgi:predicted Rossmann fold nucleotide-binding protein DprA/Smf involved in DNA uptake